MRPLDVVRAVMSPEAPLLGQDRVVLTALVMRADNATARAEMSLAELQGSTGLSRSTVIRTLDRLEHGLRVVARQRARRADGLNEINVYWLDVGALERLAQGERKPRRGWSGEQGQLFGAAPRPRSPEVGVSPSRAMVGERGGGSVTGTPPLVSTGTLGSVSLTPSLPAVLPTDLPVCSAPPALAQTGPDPHPDPHTHTRMGGSAGSEERGQGSPGAAELAAVILEELQAHQQLASLATRHDALALAEAAQTARKPAAAVRRALQQLAAKVAGNIARASRRMAVGFVINAHVHDASPPQASPVAIEAPPLSPTRSASLLAELNRRAQAERDAADAKRRADVAALVAQGKIPDPSSWGPMPKYRPRTEALPPALAALSARAEEVDGRDETRCCKRSSEAQSSSLFPMSLVPESMGSEEAKKGEHEIP